MKEITLKVEGMTCSGCENRIKNALEMVEGVQKVFANHVDGRVTITLKDTTSESAIKEKIEDIGFEVKED